MILEFYFTTRHWLKIQRTEEREQAPWAVAVGMQTFRRLDLILSGRLDVFTVRLYPIGLRQLFGIPMAHFLTLRLRLITCWGQG